MRNIFIFFNRLSTLRGRPKGVFTDMFTHCVLFGFRKVLLIGASLVLIPASLFSADANLVASADSFYPGGLFCFRSETWTNSRIHLMRYANGSFKEIFAKRVEHTVKAPICLSNAVIATSSDGVIRKLNLQGEFQFVTKPTGFDGVSAFSGKVNDNCIFMTATVYAKPGWLNYLYLVDVSGAAPVIKAKFDIIQPLCITLTFDEIVVIGERETKRLKIPREFSFSW